MAANDPLDLNASVPTDTSNNAIGTPVGQVDVPAMKTLVTSVNDAKVGDPITQPMKDAAQTLGGAFSS
ncbi:hypothetical protein GCM10010277_69550 [Streptomyces longisporoflavus]|uniref:hypothetical protein n=1 Tax=Streptomyces longisporoflavus TaxID=28044 RepID=UPI00167DBF42|nr:hypothetical protein [Streptomyces longisporoflavus]GGV63392.1 hypothetical protein GCM10010277_69550 [Streptomyces longisporoflavus]